MRRLKPYHITWATHNSRRSPRMLHYSGEPKYYVWLTNEEEIIIAESIAESVEKDKLNVKAFNICGDHVHILMVCQKEDIPKIIHNLKGRSSRALSVWYENGIQLDNGINPIALPGNPIIQERQSTSTWAQKYNVTNIFSEEQLTNTIKYIENNRIKHELDDNKDLLPLIRRIINPGHSKTS